MTPEQIDLYFHGAEIVLILIGMALPAWLGALDLHRILRDFPPHRHSQAGSITYPKGYEPPPEEQLVAAARAGR